jgi:hypothetical protein
MRRRLWLNKQVCWGVLTGGFQALDPSKLLLGIYSPMLSKKLINFPTQFASHSPPLSHLCYQPRIIGYQAAKTCRRHLGMTQEFVDLLKHCPILYILICFLA